ncbi:MAG: BON domain-containing protein [Rickettsiaceae bacterium]|nr:MAG: BON domain-containing protein [Rickettsiaceae bacterium]
MSKIVILMLLLTLSGCLPTMFTAATSTTLAVAKDRSVDETIHDITIASAIKANLIKKNFREAYTKINVEVVGGRILLTGKVNDEKYILEIVEIAWQQQGAKEVLNEIKVNERSSHFDIVQYTKDSLITGQIKSKLLLNRAIKFVNYTVVTLDNTVYLFGIARSNHELEQVAAVASTIRGVEKVISHVELRNVSSSSQEADSLRD